jgi:hypothetical protein
VAVNCCVIFTGISADPGDAEMVMARTVTVVGPDFVGSVTEEAVIVTARSLVGGVVGAVYVTELLVALLRVPPPDAGEEIVQEEGFTAAFAGSKLTMAVIVDVPCACTEDGFAERETAIAANVIVIVPEFAGPLAAVAVIVTCTSLAGGVAGAV